MYSSIIRIKTLDPLSLYNLHINVDVFQYNKD